VRRPCPIAPSAGRVPCARRREVLPSPPRQPPPRPGRGKLLRGDVEIVVRRCCNWCPDVGCCT
jgi:hypothetical protein